jgi:anthranilate synthase component 1
MYNIETTIIKTLSDTHTPVGLYLKLRDNYPGSFLLESSDYKSKENCFSYLCIKPIASFVVEKVNTKITFPDGKKETISTSQSNIIYELQKFKNKLVTQEIKEEFIINGLFGYTSYDAIPLFNKINFKSGSFNHPLIQYHFFRFLIVFNHFNNELFIIENKLSTEKSEIEELKNKINNLNIPYYTFEKIENEKSNYSDEEFLRIIEEGKKQCYFGNVFQVVLSRKFKQTFKGDDFNVYRALRSINPSPYLFYFDYGTFKVFGSSPEAQLTIADNKAYIHPIAGTFKRSGNKNKDLELAIMLNEDPKENAEHIMLVDLARNDLSKNSKSVKVEQFKQVEFYSHVIHLVSKVSGELENKNNPLKILADTYPAGTLSGAPKTMAMKIINEPENDSRGLYGGAIGILGLDGRFNHAIIIRSFVSENNTLNFQAGCGVVIKSNNESELMEVNNKTSALRKAIELANTL